MAAHSMTKLCIKFNLESKLFLLIFELVKWRVFLMCLFVFVGLVFIKLFLSIKKIEKWTFF